MPCRPVRARKFVEQGRAKKCWKKGFFYIQMLVLTEEQVQHVVVGIAPGSKRVAFTVKAEYATLSFFAFESTIDTYIPTEVVVT